jgi:hypothetical protein
MSFDSNVEQHIDVTLAKIRSIFVEAVTRIESLKGDEKVPATKLAAEIAEGHDMTGPQLYPTLLFLFKDYPGVTISRGAHGGIRKTPAVVAAVVATPAVTTPVVDEVK